MIYLIVLSAYPLTGVGDINTYAVFTELSSKLMSIRGYIGLIIPTGIATDTTYQDFFASIVGDEHLVLQCQLVRKGVN